MPRRFVWPLWTLNSCCVLRVAFPAAVVLSIQVLLCLLAFSGRFLDAFFCLLSVVLYAICTREPGYFNFSCSQTHMGPASRGTPAALFGITGAHESFGAALAHMRSFFLSILCFCSFPLSLLWCPVVFLHVMSCMQLFFASFRLLMLQVGTADEMAPPESRSQFAVFAIGAVAAPLIHVRLTGAQVRVWAGCVRAQVNQRRSLCLTVCRASACVLAVCAQATSVYFSWRLHQQLRVTRQCSHSQKQPSSSSRTHWPRCCALRSLWDGSRSA